MTKCTLVFECDIKKFSSNPFHSDTPFGKPYGVAVGDLMERCAALEAMVEYMEQGGTELEDFKKELNL